MVYSTRRFVVCLILCYFVLVFFGPFSIAITSLWEERANLSAFRTFDRFALVWICRFPLPLPLGVWEGLRLVIVACLLRFYGPVNPMRSCRARSVYLTTRLLGRLSPLSG